MNWMLLPYRRALDFTGRSRRREYWSFVALWLIVGIVLEAVFGTRTATTGQGGFNYGVHIEGGVGGTLLGLFQLVSLVPGLAVAVRRLHDQDRTGWLLLLAVVPLFGWFALLVLMALAGTRGPNRFGADPKGRVNTAEIFG